MLNTQAMIAQFCDLARIDSPSLHEAEVVAAIRDILAEIGVSAEEDDAADGIGGAAGNLIARVPGVETAPTVLLNAHVDTVQPGCGIEPLVEGARVCSAGETIVGADAKAGVTIILSVLRHLLDEGLPHPPLEMVFTVAEEIGLLGAKELDYGALRADMGIVLDGGSSPATINHAAPSSYVVAWEVRGVAAHAGVHPERGVNAIRVAAEAIAEMPLGRLDDETVANIGVISGGEATNIVPDRVVVRGETRSHDEAKLERQKDLMVRAFEAAAERHGAEAIAEVERKYSRFELGDDEPVLRCAARAAERLGLTPRIERSGGGSDANIFNERGIPSIIITTGAANAHTADEHLDADRMAESARWLVEMLTSIAAGTCA